ncbi:MULTISPECIES: hypothetical protein [Duganella]|uniref:hypothetical protein n=1 Tax=Duganella TaxID=75654 RepID=UPI00333FC4A5
MTIERECFGQERKVGCSKEPWTQLQKIGGDQMQLGSGGDEAASTPENEFGLIY